MYYTKLHLLFLVREIIDDLRIALWLCVMTYIRSHLILTPILHMQLVSVDDDLLCELDALDASGLSLLHYCCMYNLTVLVLVLLNRYVRSLILIVHRNSSPRLSCMCICTCVSTRTCVFVSH